MDHRPPLARPLGAALVRMQAVDGSWVERLPRVPAPHEMTATVVGARLADVPSAALADRGVRVLRVEEAVDETHVTLLVPVALAQAHPAWFQALLAVSDRAWDLRLGPVQALFGDTLAVHLQH